MSGKTAEELLLLAGVQVEVDDEHADGEEQRHQDGREHEAEPPASAVLQFNHVLNKLPLGHWVIYISNCVFYLTTIGNSIVDLKVVLCWTWKSERWLRKRMAM